MGSFLRLAFFFADMPTLNLLCAQPPIRILCPLFHSPLNFMLKVGTEPLFDHNGIVNIGKYFFPCPDVTLIHKVLVHRLQK